MFRKLRRLWRQLPIPVQERIYVALRATGIAYSLSYVASYGEVHQMSNFSGNLLFVKGGYLESVGRRKQWLSNQFDAIIDGLILKNGVKKTTYAMRQSSILSELLSDKAFRLEKDEIKVLDIPSSAGASSLDAYAMLSREYKVVSYVLGDSCFKIYYDRATGCIFDENRNLLQKKLKTQYFSIYRPHTAGDAHNVMANVLLMPFDLLSWHLRRRYPYSLDNHYDEITLLHPEVEEKLKKGVISIKRTDIFMDIKDKFDLIISFNLLQRNYFPEKWIQTGIENLKNAINENGLLVMGSTESFSVSRKHDGQLLLLRKEGDF